MSNVRPLHKSKSVNRQASEWIALLVTGDATLEDREHCNAWLNEDPSHKAAFDELSETWGLIRTKGEDVRVSIAAEIQSKVFLELLAVAGRRTRRRKRFIWQTAAAATVLVSVITLFLLQPFDTTSTYRTDVGQQALQSLADESTVQLNTDTELLVAYSGSERRVQMRRGEAFFDVAHDSDRPFVVEARGKAIRAVGTAFVVRVENEMLQVTVTEGLVEITQDASTPTSPHVDDNDTSAPSSSARLGIGERAEFNQRIVSVASLSDEELRRDLAWRRGILQFDGQPLDEVIREIGRYSDSQIVIADSHLRDLHVGGTFRTGDLDAVLEFFERSLGIVVTRDNSDSIVLTSSAPTDP